MWTEIGRKHTRLFIEICRRILFDDRNTLQNNIITGYT